MEVIPVVRDFITQELLQRDDVTLDTEIELIDEGYLTSLQTVMLVMFLEEQFSIEVDPTEVDEENFRTLGTIASLVERKL